MNDTTRGELRGDVWSIIRGAMNTPQADNFEAESAYRDAWASEAADKVVALVTAARDEEIREALVDSYGAVVEGAYERLVDQYERNGKVDRQCAIAAVEGALDSLHGDGTGGQG